METVEQVEQIVDIAVPALWTIGAVFGLTACVRLALFAHKQRTYFEHGGSAYNVLGWLLQLAALSAFMQFVFVIAGISVLVEGGEMFEAWSSILVLIMLSTVPWLLGWITYRAFWLRIH